MVTRVYLEANTAAALSPTFDAGWITTAAAVRRRGRLTQQAATETISGTLGGNANDNALAVQLLIGPLAAQTVGGGGNTATVTSRGREYDTADNVNKRWRKLTVVDNTGALRGTLSAIAATAATTEHSTTLSGQAHATNLGLTGVAAQDGDYIVVELGYGESATGTTPQWDMQLGGTGTDHANVNNDATGSVPWIEFSQDLVFLAPAQVTLTPAVLVLAAVVLSPLALAVSGSLQFADRAAGRVVAAERTVGGVNAASRVVATMTGG